MSTLETSPIRGLVADLDHAARRGCVCRDREGARSWQMRGVWCRTFVIQKTVSV